MNIPPAVLDLRIAEAGKRAHHVWLPLFLLWPLLLVLGVLALILTILADVVLYVLGESYHRYTTLLVRCFGMLSETRGLVVRINDRKTIVDLSIA